MWHPGDSGGPRTMERPVGPRSPNTSSEDEAKRNGQFPRPQEGFRLTNRQGSTHRKWGEGAEPFDDYPQPGSGSSVPYDGLCYPHPPTGPSAGRDHLEQRQSYSRIPGMCPSARVHPARGYEMDMVASPGPHHLGMGRRGGMEHLQVLYEVDQTSRRPSMGMYPHSGPGSISLTPHLPTRTDPNSLPPMQRMLLRNGSGGASGGRIVRGHMQPPTRPDMSAVHMHSGAPSRHLEETMPAWRHDLVDYHRYVHSGGGYAYPSYMDSHPASMQPSSMPSASMMGSMQSSKKRPAPPTDMEGPMRRPFHFRGEPGTTASGGLGGCYAEGCGAPAVCIQPPGPKGSKGGRFCHVHANPHSPTQGSPPAPAENIGPMPKFSAASASTSPCPGPVGRPSRVSGLSSPVGSSGKEQVAAEGLGEGLSGPAGAGGGQGKSGPSSGSLLPSAGGPQGTAVGQSGMAKGAGTSLSPAAAPPTAPVARGVKGGGRCEVEGCTSQPRYADNGATRPRFCGPHKLAGMVNVVSRRCFHEDCVKVPHFGMNRERPVYCGEHKLPGMVNVANRRCENEECQRQPTYGSEGDRRPRFCSMHKHPGMYDVIARRCEEEGCMVRAAFNFRGQKSVRFCASHKLEGMENLKSKCCEAEGCKKYRVYGFDGDAALCCATHKRPGMVDVRSSRCEQPGCYRHPSFGYEWQKKRRFCGKHKLPEMIDVRSRNQPQCEERGCARYPSFSFEGDRKARRCVSHKEDNMVDVRSRRCSTPGCVKGPSYCYPGEQRARCCASHRKEGMMTFQRMKAVGLVGTDAPVSGGQEAGDTTPPEGPPVEAALGAPGTSGVSGAGGEATPKLKGEGITAPAGGWKQEVETIV